MAAGTPNPLAQAVTRELRKYPTLDPQAVLAVARQEGLGGGIGDQGTSFGPFQLHYGGAYPASAPHGAQASQAWATGPQGIDYALGQIAKVAGGEKGQRAIKDIVSRFERPTNVGREISGAESAYGPPTPSVGPQPPLRSLTQAAAMTAPTPDFGQQIRRLLGPAQIGELDKTGFYTQLGNILRRRSPTPTPPVGSGTGFSPLATAAARQEPVPYVGNTKGVKPSLLSAVSQAARAVGASEIKVTSGARSAEHNAAVGGVSHSNHLTGDALDGYGLVNGQWVPLGQLLRKNAGRYGLRSGDVPGFFNGRPDPVHVDDGRNQRG